MPSTAKTTAAKELTGPESGLKTPSVFSRKATEFPPSAFKKLVASLEGYLFKDFFFFWGGLWYFCFLELFLSISLKAFRRLDRLRLD